MKAYKCDACGSFYDLCKSAYPNRFLREYRAIGVKFLGTDDTKSADYDICPNCMAKIYSIFEGRDDS